MRNRAPIVLSVLLAAATTACANDQPSSEPGARDEARRCMLVRNIQDYHVIDRHHVVFSDRGEDTFLLGTMQPGCWDLQSSFAIALETPPITLCEGDMATLRVRDEVCHVNRIEAVESVEAAEALVSERSE